MTTADIIAYYQALLIYQYAGQPNALATIGAVVTPVIMDQLPTQIQNAFCVGDQVIDGVTYPGAVGVQLDILGKYAGVTRSGYDSNGNPILLDDADFTRLIQIGIVHNSAPSTLANIDSLLNIYFPNEIFVFDNANMSMSYVISSSVGNQSLVELFVTENLLPKPMGVSISVVYLPDISLFGFQRYTGLAPAWSSTTIYAVGTEVYVSADGVTYSSAQSGNLNNTPNASPTWWTPIIEPLLRYQSYSKAYLTANTVFQFLRYSDTIDI